MRRTRGGPSMVCFQEWNDRFMASGQLLALLAACVIFIATMAGCSVSGDKTVSTRRPGPNDLTCKVFTTHIAISSFSVANPSPHRFGYFRRCKAIGAA